MEKKILFGATFSIKGVKNLYIPVLGKNEEYSKIVCMSEPETVSEPENFYRLLAQFTEEAEIDEFTEGGSGLVVSVIGAVATGAGLGFATRGQPELGATVAAFVATGAVASLHVAVKYMREVVARANS